MASSQKNASEQIPRIRAGGIPLIGKCGLSVQRVRDELAQGRGIRHTARIIGISPAKVLRIKPKMDEKTTACAAKRSPRE